MYTDEFDSKAAVCPLCLPVIQTHTHTHTEGRQITVFPHTNKERPRATGTRKSSLIQGRNLGSWVGPLSRQGPTRLPGFVQEEGVSVCVCGRVFLRMGIGDDWAGWWWFWGLGS